MSTPKARFHLFTLIAFCAAAGAVVGFVIERLFEPRPYSHVEAVEVVCSERMLAVHLRYRKTSADCTYVRGFAFASLPADRVPLSFTPIRNAGQTAQRVPGIQHLRWDIDMADWHPDTVEIWTRHNCEGRRTDLLMYTVEVPE